LSVSPLLKPPAASLAGHPTGLSRRAAAAQTRGCATRPDPPTVEEIVAVMRQAGDGAHGALLRALIVLLWRAGLRIHEALTLTEHDLEPRAGSVLVRHGKGGRRREVDMDRGAGSSSALGSNRG
jgi:integrase